MGNSDHDTTYMRGGGDIRIQRLALRATQNGGGGATGWEGGCCRAGEQQWTEDTKKEGKCWRDERAAQVLRGGPATDGETRLCVGDQGPTGRWRTGAQEWTEVRTVRSDGGSRPFRAQRLRAE